MVKVLKKMSKKELEALKLEFDLSDYGCQITINGTIIDYYDVCDLLNKRSI